MVVWYHQGLGYIQTFWLLLPVEGSFMRSCSSS